VGGGFNGVGGKSNGASWLPKMNVSVLVLLRGVVNHPLNAILIPKSAKI
jgi:hypothetical protein